MKGIGIGSDVYVWMDEENNGQRTAAEGGKASAGPESTDESEQQRQIRRLAQLPPALPSRGPFAFLAIKLAAKERERVGGEGVGQHQQQRHSTRPSSTKCGAQLGRGGGGIGTEMNSKREEKGMDDTMPKNSKKKGGERHSMPNGKALSKRTGTFASSKPNPVHSICKLTKENLNLQRKGADGNGMPKAKTV
ncbi:hypothetical protein niasHT_035462 [Heterodera trifolii]|uniref:Uncharacterized protein n=1 Tax=Heterodera trifolii TaxID=157864 RepID=A0ABD2I255_9BILA